MRCVNNEWSARRKRTVKTTSASSWPEVAIRSLMRSRTVWYRRALVGSIWLVAAILLMGGGIGLWTLDGLTAGIKAKLTWLSVEIGFRLNDIRVIGRVRTPDDHILAAIHLRGGENIFVLNVQQVKGRLEALPWVRSAIVERHLPDTLRLILVERQAVVLWQRNGRYILLDVEGAEIVDDIAPFRHLPVVVGEKAPSQVGTLLALMRSQPTLAPRVRAAQLVSGRRWNLRLDDVTHGIDIRLPEENPAEALQRLVEFDRKHGLLRRRLAMVDLRLPDRLVVRLENGGQQEQLLPMTTRRSGQDT